MATWRQASRLSLFSALAASTVLAGCALTPLQPPAPVRTSEAPNVIGVVKTQRTITLHYAGGVEKADALEAAQLDAMLDDGDIAAGDEVIIRTDADESDQERGRRLAAYLKWHDIKAKPEVTSAAPGLQVVLLVDHYKATAPNCPNWSKPPGDDFANTMPSDFGCATAADLAAMVAAPHDLLVGRTLAPEMGDSALRPLHRYLTGTVASATAGTGAPATAGGAQAPAASSGANQ